MEAPLEIRAWTLFYSLVGPLRSLKAGIMTIVHAFFFCYFYHTFQPVAAPCNRKTHRQALNGNL